MNRIRFFAALALVLFCAHIRAAAAPERFEVGPMAVQRHGASGTPVILIPGLGSGAWAWEPVVAQMEKSHTVYVVTLPGFDGRPPAPGEPFDAAQQYLLDLIDRQKIAKPVLIGHSVGGTLAIAFAEKHPDLISGVVAVDGLPVFPGTESMTMPERSATGQAIAAQIRSLTPAAFLAYEEQYMAAVGMTDAERARRIAKLVARSDINAVADYAAADMEQDLRAGLSAIRVPVLVVSPYYAADSAMTSLNESQKADYYRSLMKGVPKLEVVSIPGARHFVMLDQPEAFNREVSRFMESVAAAAEAGAASPSRHASK